MKTKILLIAFMSLLVSPAHALFEVRAGYGVNNGNPSSINDTLNYYVPGATAFKSLPGFNIDAIVKIPMVPIGFGLRYQNLGASVSTPYPGQSSSMDTKLSVTTTSLLLNYRVIDTLIYLGPVATYGLAGSGKMTFNCPACSVTSLDASAGSVSAYSIGVEGGAKLALFTAGAELGYSSITATNYTTNGSTVTDTTGANMKLALTGVYAKIILGVGF